MLKYKNEPYIDSLSVYLEDLTDREKEVFLLLLEGYTNKEISEKLFLSPYTTNNHLSKILQKTKMPSTFKLTASALNHLVKNNP